MIQTKSLGNLFSLLKNEKEFKVQICSLESIEIFEYFLEINQIKYIKNFTSKCKNINAVNLLLNDGHMNLKLKKIILYSNLINKDFIQINFKLTLDEKIELMKNKGFKLITVPEETIKLNPKSTLSILNFKPLNIGKYISQVISATQLVLIMSMLKENKFSEICKEAKNFDWQINNRFIIKCELNYLVSIKICTRKGESYRLNISNETLDEICQNNGYKRLF